MYTCFTTIKKKRKNFEMVMFDVREIVSQIVENNGFNSTDKLRYRRSENSQPKAQAGPTWSWGPGFQGLSFTPSSAGVSGIPRHQWLRPFPEPMLHWNTPQSTAHAFCLCLAQLWWQTPWGQAPWLRTDVSTPSSLPLPSQTRREIF